MALGGFGLIPLGVLDSSIIPVPGSMDLLTIILSARQQSLWFYYAFMATAGSVLGASLTYKLARKGGKETLHRRLRQWRMDKVREMLVNYGVIGASGSEISRESDPVACGVALVRRPHDRPPLCLRESALDGGAYPQ